MRKVTVGTNDTEKMTLFLQCIPEEIVQEVRLLQMTSQAGEVSYVEFFAKLQDRLRVEYSADAHRKWSEVVLPPWANFRSMTGLMSRPGVRWQG